jgi:hypothetical protein
VGRLDATAAEEVAEAAEEVQEVEFSFASQAKSGYGTLDGFAPAQRDSDYQEGLCVLQTLPNRPTRPRAVVFDSSQGGFITLLSHARLE